MEGAEKNAKKRKKGIKINCNWYTKKENQKHKN